MDSPRPLDLLPKLLPEVWLVGAALAVAVWPERVAPGVTAGLYFVVLVEVVFSLAQGTLTDVATRLRRRPPWWAVPLIAGGLALMYPEVTSLVGAVLAQGWPVFLPFLWSLLVRLRELWTMPEASRLDKLRRRALVSGRISLVLVVGGAAVAAAGLTSLLDPAGGGFAIFERSAGWWLAAAFGATAFDVVRVHRPAFAQRPRALMGRFDPLGVEDLSPL